MYEYKENQWATVVFSLVFLFFTICDRSDGDDKMPVHHRPNVAHRGASYLAPENTLMAYRVAISAGAHGAECDVYATSDNVPVLFHDKTTVRITGDKREISSMRFEEIRKIDAGLPKGKQYQGEKIPTLDEYLTLLKGTTCHPIIEIKQDGIETLVIDLVRKHGMTEVSTIIAFSPAVVKEFRRLEPNLCVAWLYYENLKDKGIPEENAERLSEFLKARCKELDTTIVDVHHGILSEKLVHSLRSAGLHVWCWTVNDVDRMQTLLDWGVESITTDRPELLTVVLKKQIKRSR